MADPVASLVKGTLDLLVLRTAARRARKALSDEISQGSEVERQ